MGRSSAKIIAISERAVDAKQALIEALGHFDHEVLHNRVLVATYIQPAKTQGGIIIPQKTRDEDIYQGNVGLVIGLGPGAFKDDAVAQFHGVRLNLHDWVLYLPADGLSLEINQVPCRLFADVDIRMRVTDPSIYW